MTVHQTSHKPKVWQQYPHQMFAFIISRVPRYFFLIKADTSQEIKRKTSPSRVAFLFFFLSFFFLRTLEDLRVRYSEAPNACWCDQRYEKPTAAPTLDTSPHIRREACHGWRKTKEKQEWGEFIYSRIQSKHIFSTCTSHKNVSILLCHNFFFFLS